MLLLCIRSRCLKKRYITIFNMMCRRSDHSHQWHGLAAVIRTVSTPSISCSPKRVEHLPLNENSDPSWR